MLAGCKLYEEGLIQPVTGETIRPGGFNLTERALSFGQLAPGSRVLDLGCGSGATAAYLVERHKLKVVGIDPSEVLLEKGRRLHPELKLLNGRGENLPFGDAKFDCVLAECTLSVMENREMALAECYRVLKVGGTLFVSALYNKVDTVVLNEAAHSCPLCGVGSLQELTLQVNRSGFEVSLCEDHSDLLKRFVIDFIMEYGSMKPFWAQLAGKRGDVGKSAPTGVGHGKLGYLLLVAVKPDK